MRKIILAVVLCSLSFLYSMSGAFFDNHNLNFFNVETKLGCEEFEKNRTEFSDLLYENYGAFRRYNDEFIKQPGKKTKITLNYLKIVQSFQKLEKFCLDNSEADQRSKRYTHIYAGPLKNDEDVQPANLLLTVETLAKKINEIIDDLFWEALDGQMPVELEALKAIKETYLPALRNDLTASDSYVINIIDNESIVTDSDESVEPWENLGVIFSPLLTILNLRYNQADASSCSCPYRQK